MFKSIKEKLKSMWIDWDYDKYWLSRDALFDKIRAQSSSSYVKLMYLCKIESNVLIQLITFLKEITLKGIQY